MNIKLIDQFRNKVNEHGLVLHLYRNKNGKNQWSIICSAMDWISVVVEEIDISKLTFKNDNSSSVKVMTYISCIDVLWEAIQQLHRVFYHTSEIPYKDDDTIFKHKLFQSTDNEYFKTIRACFASHQVNLKDNFTGKGKNEQRYASWSGGFRDGHFSVFLYSNEPDIPDIPLSIYFDELQIFAEKRYDYLKKVMEEIDHQIKNYFEEQRKILIDKSKFVVNQIRILIEESKKRLDNDYYKYELEKLRIMFETHISNELNRRVVESYRNVLQEELEELFNAIQEMRLDELDSVTRTEVSLPAECLYPFSKLSDAVYGDGYTSLVASDNFKKYIGDIVDLENIESTRELYVVIKAGFYKYYTER